MSEALKENNGDREDNLQYPGFLTETNTSSSVKSVGIATFRWESWNDVKKVAWDAHNVNECRTSDLKGLFGYVGVRSTLNFR